MGSFPPADLLDALEERGEDVESWEQGLSLFTGLLFSDVEPVSKHTHRKHLVIIGHTFTQHFTVYKVYALLSSLPTHPSIHRHLPGAPL